METPNVQTSAPALLGGSDVSAFEIQDAAEYTLLTPNGDRTEVVFTIAGPTHPARERFEKAASRRAQREFNKKGKASIPDDPDELLEMQIERVATFTLGWRGLIVSGKPVSYSPAAALELIGNARLAWIRDQLDAAQRDQALFTRSSAAA
jgi:hypothetical protein